MILILNYVDLVPGFLVLCKYKKYGRTYTINIKKLWTDMCICTNLFYIMLRKRIYLKFISENLLASHNKDYSNWLGSVPNFNKNSTFYVRCVTFYTLYIENTLNMVNILNMENTLNILCTLNAYSKALIYY